VTDGDLGKQSSHTYCFSKKQNSICCFCPCIFYLKFDKDLFSLYQTTLFGPYYTGLCIYPYFVNIACILYMNKQPSLDHTIQVYVYTHILLTLPVFSTWIGWRLYLFMYTLWYIH